MTVATDLRPNQETISNRGFNDVAIAANMFEDRLIRDCWFEDANLTKVSLGNSRFVNCTFTDCSISGTVGNTVFENCKFLETHFLLEGGSLAFPGSVFDSGRFFCFLNNLDFRGGIIRYSDFTGTRVTGDFFLPVEVELMSDLPQKIARIVTKDSNLLNMGEWHSRCGTQHCIAGWAVEIHPQGWELQNMVGPQIAGRVLVPSLEHLFFVSNDEALKALKTIA